jgi:hypothetical protein
MRLLRNIGGKPGEREKQIKKMFWEELISYFP